MRIITLVTNLALHRKLARTARALPSVTACLVIAIQGVAQAGDGQKTKSDFKQYIKDCAVSREVIRENPLPTPQSLYQMSNLEWIVENLKDDLALQSTAYSAGDARDLDRERISKLAASLEFTFDWSLEFQQNGRPGVPPGRPNSMTRPMTRGRRFGCGVSRKSLR